MRIADMTWRQVESYLRRDDRAVLPIGSTEQHAGLSLATDIILAARVALEAAEPLGVPVFPGLVYGITPTFRAYPGTISLKVETMLRLVGDVLDSLAGQGFRRVLIVNGHGGNAPVLGFLAEWLATHPKVQVRLHNWWNAPRTWAQVQATDPIASHASWMENFPWTRVLGEPVPKGAKPMIDPERLRLMAPEAARAYLGDGNYGGRYGRPDREMLAIWKVAVEETQDLIENGWL
ncbi:MAG TPA: creatininase family protein [Aliidongia sp.]|uniref:creatininase family protein n=1 Tax=Aliidongia sp. TaxID=1914230 RepID=UPI002DDCA21E|nr:creatininase family protein [Aliidongia sp.]HEV2674441.1 creatininase family protein [Aliidongia sp.]